jgi:arylsulfatase A-like enzyme
LRIATDVHIERHFCTSALAAVGQIVAQLERSKLRERTLLLFCSDNGGDRQGRAGKASVYEGGVRSAALANWPGTLAPGTLEHPICIVDWMPTICSLAGAKPPDRLDGQDVWPLLSGAADAAKPRPIYLLGMHGQTSALVEGDWKLVRTKSGDELYDLSSDPAEARNLAAQHPRQVESLRRMLEDAARLDRDRVAPEVAAQR